MVSCRRDPLGAGVWESRTQHGSNINPRLTGLGSGLKLERMLVLEILRQHPRDFILTHRVRHRYEAPAYAAIS